jgi:hypothetical protein
MLQLQLPTHSAQCNEEYVVLHDPAYIKKEPFMEMVSAHSVEGYIRIHYSAKKTALMDTPAYNINALYLEFCTTLYNLLMIICM